MTAPEVYARLAVATFLALAPGWALARALGVRGVAATLAWSLALLFGALAVTFAFQESLSLAIVLLAAAGASLAVYHLRRPTPTDAPPPGRGWAALAGATLGVALWAVAGEVQGDGLFHLARARKLVALDELSLEGVGEFADAGLHPGYAFPLWHGFLAVVARLSGVDAEQVVVHLPSLLAPLAVVVAYEAGWALFRRGWAAGTVAAAQVTLVCFAPGSGGAYRVLSLPATASDQLLVPAAIALTLAAIRGRSPGLFASVAAAGFVLAVVHPTYALFLWVPVAGFLLVRALWTRRDLLAGAAAIAGLAVPAVLFLLWLAPIAADTASVTPDREEVRRAFAQYQGQLDVRSETSYGLAAEVFTRRGAVALAALALLPLAALASRRRWAAFVSGASLAVFAATLVPLLFTQISDVVSISQSRRLAAFLPFAFAFAGGFGVLSRVVGPLLPGFALVAGAVLQWVQPGDFDYRLDESGPAWIVWAAVAGGVVGLVVGFVRRGRPLEAPAGLAAGMFLLPVVAVGLAKWTPEPTPPASVLSTGLVEAVRADVPPQSIVYSDQETSYRLAAFAPVYIAVAPPGNVADTEKNRPRERARDAREFLRTSDLAIPERYGAQYLVVDRLRLRRDFDLPELYRDVRFVLYRLPPQ